MTANPSGDPRLDPDFIRKHRSSLITAADYLPANQRRTYDLGPKPYGLEGNLILTTRATTRFLIVTMVNGEAQLFFRAVSWERAKEIVRRQYNNFGKQWWWLVDQKNGGVVGVTKAKGGKMEVGFVEREGNVMSWKKGRGWVEMEEVVG